MKILIYSPYFYPSVGGLETVVFILAHEFVRQGHQVKLISQTLDLNSSDFPFEVFRRPSSLQILELAYWSDIYFQANISLKGIWPLLLIGRPFVVTHQGWYCRLNTSIGWQDHLKYFVARFATNICASQAIAEHISAPSVVIPNTYQDDLFHEIFNVSRDQQLAFLGRLVSDKGADLVIESLFYLKQIGLTPQLTIIGSGPEETKLWKQTEDLNLTDQVSFVGVKTGEELVRLLNAHQILVVPSRWEEPFGIVALEGIACGCVVVGSEGGGLKEAIGPCGLTFPNGNTQSLTKILADLLNHPSKLSVYRENASQHLAHHQKAEVAKAYLQVFKEALH